MVSLHVSWRPDLLDQAPIEDSDPVAHDQRLFLVMGDVDEGDADTALDLLQLDLHLLAQLQVKRTERLVEEEHPRPIDEGTSQGHSLALPARELRGSSLLVPIEPDHVHRLGGPGGALRGGRLPHHQAVRHVLPHRHVREEGVVLEDGVDVAVEGRDPGHVLAVEQDATLGRLFEASDHAQGGGLPRSRRSEHREELAVANLEIDPRHRLDVAEALDEVLESDRWSGARGAAVVVTCTLGVGGCGHQLEATSSLPCAGGLAHSGGPARPMSSRSGEGCYIPTTTR
jgi:hypothetical protein